MESIPIKSKPRSNEKISAKEREFWKWDELQVVMAVGFITWIMIDAFFLITTFLGAWIGNWVRLAAGVCITTAG
nr:hypothetical protein [Candidatus Sigynarchaeota archaeon]